MKDIILMNDKIGSLEQESCHAWPPPQASCQSWPPPQASCHSWPPPAAN